MKSFKKYCISSAIDKTLTGMLRNGGNEEDWNVGTECKEGDGVNCEDGQSDTDW